jgi:pyrroline-5-carboxylate reductase
MGSAMVRGWLRAGLADIEVHDKQPERAAALAEVSGGRVRPVTALSDLSAPDIIVAVKPQDMSGVLSELGRLVDASNLVLSTAAGVTLDRLRQGLGPEPAVGRVMPNLAVALGEGVLALALESDDDAVRRRATRLMSSLGHVEFLPERLFDAVTALTASGPGLLALVLEGLEDGGVRSGLPRDVARTFTAKMAGGAVRLLVDEGIAPSVLKDRVASPGGTTIAGLAVLEDRGVRGALLRAVEAAADRGREL